MNKKEIIEFIKSERLKKSKDIEIKKALDNYGFTKKEIEDAFKEIKIEESKALFKLKSTFSESSKSAKSSKLSNTKYSDDDKKIISKTKTNKVKDVNSSSLDKNEISNLKNNHSNQKKDTSYGIKFIFVILIILIFGVLLYIVFSKELFLFNSFQDEFEFNRSFENYKGNNSSISGTIKITKLIKSYDVFYTEIIDVGDISENDFKELFKIYQEDALHIQPIIVTKYNFDFYNVFNLVNQDNNSVDFDKITEFNETLYFLKENGYNKEMSFVLDKNNYLRGYSYILKLKYKNQLYDVLNLSVDSKNNVNIVSYNSKGFSKNKTVNIYQIVDYINKESSLLDSLIFDITTSGKDTCSDLDEETCKSKIGCFPEYDFDIYGNMNYIGCR